MKTPSNPIDEMVLALRELSASPERVVARITPVRRLPRSVPPVLIGAVALAVAFVLRPQPALASSWDQVVANSTGMIAVHIREFDPNGHQSFELWRSGSRRANWYAPSWAHRVILEERTDGNRMYRFSESSSPDTKRRASNHRDVGTLHTTRRPGGIEKEPLFLNDLRKFAEVFQADVTEVRDGRRLSYRVRQRRTHRVGSSADTSRWAQDTFLVRTDDRQRITETIANDGRRTVYDYPDRIPSSVFEPRPQKRIVPVVDVDAVKRVAAERIRRGAGTRNGVTLRLLALDRDGNVWILWTGAPPSGALTRKARIVGVPTHGAFGPGELTSAYRKTGLGRIVPSIGRRMEGHGVAPTVRIGSHLTVEVPARRGTATFRDVPVLPIATLTDISAEIGIGGPRNVGK